MKLSQSKLAELVGVSNKAVSKWETGCAKPQIDTVKKLSAILGVSVDELGHYVYFKTVKKKISDVKRVET